MKKLLLMLVLASSTIIACKKDKEKHPLEGRWDFVQRYTAEYQNGQKTGEYTEQANGEENYFRFQSDGTFTEVSDGQTSTGTFSSTDSTITITYTDGGDTLTYGLRWGNSNQVVISYEESETSGNVTSLTVREITFKRQ